MIDIFYTFMLPNEKNEPIKSVCYIIFEQLLLVIFIFDKKRLVNDLVSTIPKFPKID